MRLFGYMKYYTIGQIYRMGLLKNFNGEPYKDKSAVSHVINKMRHKTIKTPWGVAKAITINEIKKHNKNMFRPGDPIIKKHSQKVRELEAKHPNRDWRFNLSQEQIKKLKIAWDEYEKNHPEESPKRGTHIYF